MRRRDEDRHFYRAQFLDDRPHLFAGPGIEASHRGTWWSRGWSMLGRGPGRQVALTNLSDGFGCEVSAVASFFRVSIPEQDCLAMIDSFLMGRDLSSCLLAAQGVYEQYGFTHVTHVIADNLAAGNQQWAQLKKRTKRVNVVTSSWIMDCVKEGRRTSTALIHTDSL